MTLLETLELKRNIACWTRVLGAPVQTLAASQLSDEIRLHTIIWDVRSRTEWQAGHPEGALTLGGVDWLLADAFGGNLVPRPVIANRLGEIGIAPDKRVVVYGPPGSIDVLIALRALRSIGVRDLAVCDAAPAPATV